MTPRLLALPVLAVLAFVALGGVVGAAAGAPPLRGQMVDIGGRDMHIVCEGPAGDGPTLVFESGVWGFSADWGAVQQLTTQRGWRSCAYDRAGMGFSEAGPGPRDGLAIAADLERLLDAAKEPGPYILVGHSMAGLRLPTFAQRNPQRVAGLVLADPTVPDVEPEGLAATLRDDSFWGALVSSIGLLKPFANRHGDRMGLPAAAKAEKIHAFGLGRHARTTFAEGRAENEATRQMIALGPLDPALPVAVITAGPERPERPGRKLAQASTAHRSQAGYYRNIEAATHNSLLGVEHAGAIVEGIAHVREAARARGGAPGGQ
jgi:pimeloyl-ACP methyl ester carboxylesterase